MEMAVANFLGTWIGATIYGIFLIYLVQWFWEFVLFKRVMDDPVLGKLGSTIAAYFTVSLLIGWAGTIDGAFDFMYFPKLLLSAIVVGFFAVKRGIKIRDKLSGSEELEEIFDCITMKKVPFSAATPDVVGQKSFFMERIGEYAALAFRDVLPAAARAGGRVIITYPYVLALCEAKDGSIVLFVTVEKSEVQESQFLCGFDGKGIHMNFGPWDMDEDSDAFVERAIEIAREHLDNAG